MKHLLLIWGLFLLFLSGSAKEIYSPKTPLDTISGHARLVRKLSQDICTRLANDHATNFKSLTNPQAMQLTQQLFTEAMQHDSVAVIALMTAAVAQNQSPQQVGQLLGKDVVIQLSSTCPASMPLILRLTQTEEGQQAITVQQAVLMSDAERKVLQPIAAAVCTQLATDNAKVPFASLTPSQRQKTVMDVVQKVFRQHTAKLTSYYGAAQLDKKLRNGDIDRKIGNLMPSQGNCAEYILLMNESKPTK